MSEKPLKPAPKSLSAILGMLEGGSFQHEATEELTNLCAAISEHHAVHGKAKGKLTLTLSLNMEGGVVDATAEIAVKAPKLKRDKTVFWLDESNSLTQSNPKQIPMELRSVPAPAAAEAATGAPAAPAVKRV